jgi:hypothetical protein
MDKANALDAVCEHINAFQLFPLSLGSDKPNLVNRYSVKFAGSHGMTYF